MTYRCFRCKRRFKMSQLIDFLEDGDTLSPRFCKPCYLWVVEHWEEGMTVMDFEEPVEEESES